MPQSTIKTPSRKKLFFSLGFLFIALILPISMAAIYRTTSYTPKATDLLPVTPPYATTIPTVEVTYAPSEPPVVLGEILPNNPILRNNFVRTEVVRDINSVSSAGFEVNSGSLSIEDGYGDVLRFEAEAGEMIVLQSYSTNMPDMRIGSAVYGPDFHRISLVKAGQNEFIAPVKGEYIAVIYSHNFQTGFIETRVFNYRIRYSDLQVLTNKNELQSNHIPNGWRQYFGRSPAKMIFKVGKGLSLSDNHRFVYQQINDFGQPDTRSGIIHIRAACSSSKLYVSPQRYQDIPFKTSLIGDELIIEPAKGEYFAPGKAYSLNFQDDGTPDYHVFQTGFELISPSGLIADIDNNWVVDMLDYTYLTSEIFSKQSLLLADFDCSGEVDMLDYTMLLNELGTTLQPSSVELAN